MAVTDVEFIGKELGQHGSNIYFREFSVRVEGKVKNYKLGKFYVVRRNPTQPICIAEFQLIWKNIKDGGKLASAKLYFRPEDTPYGRQSDHGEDELLEADRHVAIYCEEMPRWECEIENWETGNFAYQNLNSEKTKQFLKDVDTSSQDEPPPATEETRITKSVKILGYPGYCRYKTCLKLLQTGHTLSKKMLLAKGAIELSILETRILFSRCKFSHPSIEDYVFSGDLKLPVFKGRPRKRKPTNIPVVNGRRVKSIRLNCEDMTRDSISLAEAENLYPIQLPDDSVKSQIPSVYHTSVDFEQNPDRFLENVQTFMKQLGSPITKIPKVAFTRVSLFRLFQLVNSYGGYAQVTMNHKWKRVYDALGLATTITSAATCIRRHYERLLLPYEKFLRHRHKIIREEAQHGSVKETKDSSPIPTSDTYVKIAAEGGENEKFNNSDKAPSLSMAEQALLTPDTSYNLSSHNHHQANGTPSAHDDKFFVNSQPLGTVQAMNLVTGPTNNPSEGDGSPQLPLKLVIQRRRGRPPKYLKAQLEELKSLAQKARIGQLCQQRPSKRGRKPKSTVLRISVGPDGIIRSEDGNIQLGPEQVKQVSNSSSDDTKSRIQGNIRNKFVQTSERIDTKKDLAHPAIMESRTLTSLKKEVVITPRTSKHDRSSIFNGYKPSHRKFQLDALLPNIEQSYLNKLPDTPERSLGVSPGLFPKHEYVKECSRPSPTGLVSMGCQEHEEQNSMVKFKILECVEKKYGAPAETSHNNDFHKEFFITKQEPINNNFPTSEAKSAQNGALNLQQMSKHISSLQSPSIQTSGLLIHTGRKVGPPPLVPIDGSSSDTKTCQTSVLTNVKIKKEESDSTPSYCVSKKPSAISLASVLPNFNIVSKPFDVESLIKPLTLHIDQSLQNIKETVDAKMSGVMYTGDEDTTVTKDPESSNTQSRGRNETGVVFANIDLRSHCDKFSHVNNENVLESKGSCTGSTGILFVPKVQQKGVNLLKNDTFIPSSEGIKERDIGTKFKYAVEHHIPVPTTSDGMTPGSRSSYLHSTHFSSHYPIQTNNSTICSRSTKYHNPNNKPTVETSSHRCSCNSVHVSNSQRHHHHHHHHSDHHRFHHSPYYRPHMKHFHSSDGKVTATSTPQMDVLLRKIPTPGHRCHTVTTNGTKKLIEYHHLKH